VGKLQGGVRTSTKVDLPKEKQKGTRQGGNLQNREGEHGERHLRRGGGGEARPSAVLHRPVNSRSIHHEKHSEEEGMKTGKKTKSLSAV